MEDEIGFRGTLSYVDQFEFGNGSLFGVSAGLQKSKISQPEAEVRSSSPTGSSRWACLYDPSVTWEGFYRGSSGDCEDQRADAPYDPDGDGDFSESNQGYITDINPATGKAYSDGYRFGFAPSSRGYRQNDTSDERDSYFIALQLQPNERWDINFDMQISERVQAEERHDLNFANQKRATNSVTGDALVVSGQGAILEWAGDTAIESNSEIYSREEDYLGYGLSAKFDVNDRLRLSGDYSYSETTREELQITLRLQSDDQDIENADTPGGYRPRVSWKRNGDEVPQYTLTDFNVNDHTLFSDEYRARIDSDVDRKNTVEAFRGDFEYDLLDMDLGFISDMGIVSVQGGFRHSELEYLNLGGTRTTTPNLDDSSQAERDAIKAMNEKCRNTSFPEDNFLSSVSNGSLITQVDSNGAVVPEGTGNTWATFDTQCMVNEILAYHGDNFAYPAQNERSGGTTDVTETTLAAYVMANFNTEVGGYTVRGDFGFRVLETEVESVGYRAEYTTSTNGGFLELDEDADNLSKVTADGSYTEWLPSANVIVDLRDDLLLRGAIFRAISRADPSDLGNSRELDESGEDTTEVANLISASGSGNPFTEPLPSWNIDFAVEWYPNEDAILAVNAYLKKFTGGFEQNRVTESFIVDGQPVSADFTTTETTDDTSTLFGIEVTGAYRWPNGIGFKVSYNWADSDFEFEDSNYGDITIRDTDGSIFSQTAGIVEPGNVPGFSESVFSGQLLYEWRNLDTALIYKYRSEYFQPYTSNGTRLRYVGDVGVWEFRASYNLDKHWKFSFEAINLLDEPKSQYFYVEDALGELNSYGPRVFFGAQYRY